MTAALLPLVFIPTFGDAFSLPKLALLFLLVPFAAAGPIGTVAMGGAAAPGRRPWPDVAALAFAALAVVAWAVSGEPEHNLLGEPLQYQGLLPLLLYVTTYFLTRFAMRDPVALRRLFGGITIAGGLVGAYAVLQQVGLDPIWHALDRGRVFSTLGQANNLAAYLVIAVPASVALVVAGGKTVRALAAIALLLMLAALLLTLSRGGYLGLGAEVLVVLALLASSRRIAVRGPHGWRRVGQAGIAVVVVLLALVALTPTRELMERAVQRAASAVDLRETSIQDRLDLWAVGLRITLDHPLVGTGPDSYALVFASYRDTTLPPTRAAFMARFRPESPHDVYLALGSGLGLPALACYIALIAGTLIAIGHSLPARGRKGQVLGAALMAAIVGHVVTMASMRMAREEPGFQHRRRTCDHRGRLPHLRRPRGRSRRVLGGRRRRRAWQREHPAIRLIPSFGQRDHNRHRGRCGRPPQLRSSLRGFGCVLGRQLRWPAR
jgi:O-antigen ligase